MRQTKKIQRDILNLLGKNTIPISTREIALKIKRPWHTAQLNCLKLQLERKVDGIRIGNINAWTRKKDG